MSDTPREQPAPKGGAMSDLAELDLSRVFVHDGYSLRDVTTVGRHKAIGYVAISPTPTERFRPPEIDFRQIGETLESRGMRVYYDGPPTRRGHQQEIAELVRQLPPVRYNRKLVPGYFFPGENTDIPHKFFAADPVTIERLLAANREALYGFPPTVDAFVDLVRSVWIDPKLPLGKLIHLAFGYYKLYGGREIPRLFEPEQPEPSQPPIGQNEVSLAALKVELDRCEKLFAGQKVQFKQLSQDIRDACENIRAFTAIHNHLLAARERKRMARLLSEQERILEEQEGLLANIDRLMREAEQR